MEQANIIITNAKVTPNPIIIKNTFMISIEIDDIVYGILTKSGNYIMEKSGNAIEYIPRKII